ncbi:Hypothetical predicted protein [Prunus dulcis]|uniref:Uncharacterized protein n=1 Tax=Prunus dulcis TaxID=3755 RepID=A0A5E4ESQ8_PRUDU|nr:Hypothetical predicted protein [Prunus dulcis]
MSGHFCKRKHSANFIRIRPATFARIRPTTFAKGSDRPFLQREALGHIFENAPRPLKKTPRQLGILG